MEIDQTIHCVMADLDDTHVFIHPERVDELQKKFEELEEENHYTFVK